MDLLRQTLALALVFGLLWAARWLLRRNRSWRIRPGAELLESRAKLALTARHSVHLVRIGDRTLILALHPEGITFLGDSARTESNSGKDDQEGVAKIGNGAR